MATRTVRYAREEHPVSSSTTPGVLVVAGYGLRLGVERSHLIVADGIGETRRVCRFSRVDRELRRVLIIGHCGTISLDAIRWLHAVRVPLVHLDTDGSLFFVSAPSAAMIPQLRRAQALAPSVPWGRAVARELLRAKIDGQLKVLHRLEAKEDVIAFVADTRQALDQADSLPDLRRLEAEAARGYWSAWADVPVRFAARDAARRPSHWQRFGSRYSMLTRTSRKAVNPGNALLNYVYSLLEAEARIATLAVGLDPMVGVLHSDTIGRDSLVCDVMEPLRPTADAYLLEVLERRTFVKEDFFEHLDGHCRVMPPLTQELASSVARWARLALPLAQTLASALREGAAKAAAENLATRPFSNPRKNGVVRPQRPASREFGVATTVHDGLPRRTCPGCGGRMAKGSQICRACQRAAVRPRALGERLPAASPDPRQLPDSRQLRREAMLAVKAANDRWEAGNDPRHDAAWFRRNVLPGLQRFSLVTLQSATGLSNGACSLIRRGRVVPHQRHWNALAALTRS